MASLLKRIQRDAYLASRAAGDLDAARRGPDVYARRVARRITTRTIFNLLRK